MVMLCVAKSVSRILYCLLLTMADLLIGLHLYNTFIDEVGGSCRPKGALTEDIRGAEENASVYV